MHSERNSEEYALYFVRNLGLDLRRYNIPVTAECAALMVSKDGQIPDFDLCTYPTGSNDMKNLNKLSAHVDPMVFPLLFSHGDLGWSTLLKQNSNIDKRLSVLQHYSYRLAIRH